MYYLSYFCPFGRQKVEKAPSWLHLWLAFSTNAQNSKIREVMTAPFINLHFLSPYVVHFKHYVFYTQGLSIRLAIPRKNRYARKKGFTSLAQKVLGLFFGQIFCQEM